MTFKGGGFTRTLKTCIFSPGLRHLLLYRINCAPAQTDAANVKSAVSKSVGKMITCGHRVAMWL